MFDCWFTNPDAEFNLGFTQVGNPVFLGIEEELVETQIDNVCDYITKTYGDSLTEEEMNHTLSIFKIDYPYLPQYLKDRLDEFNIVI